MKRFFSRYAPSFRALFGSWLIAAGWVWYHVYRHPYWLYFLKGCAVWLAVLVVYSLGKRIYRWLTRRYQSETFWTAIFYDQLDTLFSIGSLLFAVFFFRNEIATLMYSVVIFYLLYRSLQSTLARHPRALELLKINRAFAILAGFLFALQAVFQYSAYHFYILDSNIRFYDIVFFRATAMTIFWLTGFALAAALYVRVKNVSRWIAFILWSLFFVLTMAVWAVNIAILYYSGLYISPVAIGHVAGAGSVIFNSVAGMFLAMFGAVLVGLIIALRQFIRGVKRTLPHFVYAYAAIFVAAIFGIIFGVTSFRNTPEAIIVKSFYDFYFGHNEQATLDPVINKKLEKFGLHYNPDTFFVNDRARVFTPTSTPLLAKRFEKNKPNIVIVYVESFSARFSGVYNPTLQGVTPNFDAFMEDPHTTVFTNYYNASTPTITGTLSQQCSFLPPTGHNEIQNERKLQNHHLLCLPEVLKQHAGFKYAGYVTAVDKEFANKDGIFTSMGVDKIYGTSELAKSIPEAPLSWGYSDHQMFPDLFRKMQATPQPFLYMLATVDTHPPFNLAKDEVKYGDGDRPVLNSFHTTDDAFGKFWEQFKESPFYDNTMVIVVGDHAIFPGAVTTDIFPADGGKMTYYDKNFFAMYVPDSVLPKKVDILASGIDELPTILQIFDINIPNSFEGHSVFDDRAQYPNVLGMHELGLYINQLTKNGRRTTLYDTPETITCPTNYSPSATPDLTLCDYLQFYRWKRLMFEQGRFWKH